MKTSHYLLLFVFLSGTPGAFAATNLVANGSFEIPATPSRVLHWAAAGNPKVQQRLTLDPGYNSPASVRLECTEFSDNGPDFHAMICQVGKVSVRKGQWYRLSLRAKASNLKAGGVEVSLVNMRPWSNAGLAEAFTPHLQWEPFEFLFRASTDLPAEASRLQFWFKSTGTLWLDDVEVTESTGGQQWYPQLTTQGVKNFVPNSSFECGSAGWGSFTYGLSGWAGALYRLEGQLDNTFAQHGTHSFKIALSPSNQPLYSFDYYEPVRQPVRRVLVANQGWFKVQPGEKLTLSAFLRADVDGLTAQMVANEAPSHLLRQGVTVGTTWQRFQFSFTPSQSSLFIGVGLDLEASRCEAGTLWVDSVQLEKGALATAYEPRLELEAFVATGVEGNLFTNANEGASFILQAFNNSKSNGIVRGRLGITDFFEKDVFEGRPTINLPPGQGGQLAFRDILKNQRGYFRANWEYLNCTQSLRCSIFEPVTNNPAQSPIGFNHAYPWNFLVKSAQRAGVGCWRDWSAKWQTVEPEKGKFDFSVADAQIHRVLDLGGQVEVLLPFPAAAWSTTARPDEVEQSAEKNSYLKARLPMAYAPKDWNDFGRYAAEVARHYGSDARGRAATFQILNEPVYTDYALPQKFGFSLQDYLRCLETGYRAIKSVNPQYQVVGGISANIAAGLTREFVEQNGLQFLDVFDLHLYDPPRPAENYEGSFQNLEANMRAHGGPKPVWITEWGCYADDDLPCVPPTVGDATMNRCRWGSERAASEHIVKFVAVGFAHGLRKLFFHAGTCGTLNGPDAGGVLFEYGGTPRKMLPAVAALTRLFGTPDEFVRKIENKDLIAYCFRKQNQCIAIAWCLPGHTQSCQLTEEIEAHDIVGNKLATANVMLSETPLYLSASNAKQITSLLAP